MRKRILGKDLTVSAVSLGCMGMTHAFGAPSDTAEMTKILHEAVDIGYIYFDTAECYTGENPDGTTAYNEELVGKALAPYRDKVVIASKFGVRHSPNGLLTDSRPDTIRRSVEGSLKRLGTDHIDLYYQNRIDPDVAPETVAEVMAELIREGTSFIMLDDDVQMSALPSTGYIKNLITAKIPVDVEAKGQQSRQAEIYARFICFGNGSPKALYDKSDGFARRLIILTTKPVPSDRVPNPNITDEFISEKEKIFCWIFEGLKRLIANNFRFTVSEKAKRNVAELVSENCNIIDFLADRNYIAFGKDLEATSNDLFGGYSHWCSQNDLTPMKQHSFTC